MLNIARENADAAGVSDILWLCQDIRDFELYGTVELVVSCLDTMNHLTTVKDFKKCLSLVHNYLSPNGLFVFDVNGEYKFKNVYGNENYVIETDDSFCVWQNWYNEKTKICDFYITLFSEADGGVYRRYDESQKEKMYKISALKKYLSASGFEFIGAYSDFECNEASDSDERIYIVAKCKK